MNKIKFTPKIIIITIIVLLVLWSLSAYNSLVQKREAYIAQWAQVENQYQRRFDLIPNLVSLVKSQYAQEESVFLGIAEARTRYSNATTREDKIQAVGQVETGLGRLLAVIESYPQLSSSASVQNAMIELSGTENRVAVERQGYNDIIKSYNLEVKRIPGVIFAKLFNFNEEPYFEAAKGSDIAPKIEDSFKK